MGPDSLQSLDAVLQGLHTLAETAEGIEDQDLRNRLTGTIVGLRAVVLTARDQILQMQERYEQQIAQLRQAGNEPRREAPLRVEWGCYQFADTEGIFCAVCFDKRGRKIRATVSGRSLVCPHCRATFPMS